MLLSADAADGALTLSDALPPLDWSASCAIGAGATVWRGLEAHGDAKLTELPVTLTNRPKARSAVFYDRCRAVYEGLGAR